MKGEFSEKEVACRLKQASLLRRLCLSLGSASVFGISGTAHKKEVDLGEKGHSSPTPSKDSNRRSQ
jgi:hypothetical protein